MKKAAVICVAIASMVAAILVVLLLLGSVRHNAIVQQPLTVQELKQLVQPATPLPGKAADAAPEAAQPDRPGRLNQPATDEQRREFFVSGRRTSSRLIARIGSGPLGGIFDTAAAVTGWPEVGSINLALANTVRGNWKEAEAYWSQLVREIQNDPLWQQRALAHMAWLEDNPELAAQYMEAACSGGDLFSIAMCVELATKTGSADLAEYYTRLGRSIYADFDSQFAVFKTDRWQSILLDRKPEPDK